MKKLMYTFFLLTAFLFAFYVPQATISGKVTSAGKGVAGVDVSVQGSNQGAVSNMQGNYTVEAGAKADTLIFTSLGYQTQKVAIGGRTTINVELKAE